MAVVPTTPSDWLKRYWLWAVAIGVLFIFLAVALFKGGVKKVKLLKDTIVEADKVHAKAEEELDAHIEKMASQEKEFKVIEAIDDEEERLQALADFANRTGQ